MKKKRGFLEENYDLISPYAVFGIFLLIARSRSDGLSGLADLFMGMIIAGVMVLYFTIKTFRLGMPTKRLVWFSPFYFLIGYLMTIIIRGWIR